MTYPAKNLNTNEIVALDMHPHWWFFAEPASALLASIVFGIVVLAKSDSSANLGKGLRIAALAALVITALWLLRRYTKWLSTNFVITNFRLIFRQGVVAKSGIEIPLERVNNVNFAQSVFERILGAGNLLIESGGEDGQQRFTDIRHPARVQNLIHAQMEEILQRRSGLLAAPAAPDVASQLERLEGMLHRGSLSQDEFDAQKRKLLGP